jgi:hypothetical protein
VDAEPRPLVAVAQGGLRLFHDPAVPERDELYDRRVDPGEHRNVAARRPDDVQALRALADAYLATPAPDWGVPEERQLDEMRLNQLRALGYVMGRDE